MYVFLYAYRQSGDFNVEYADTFPELKSMNLNTSTVLAQVTQDKYNFGTVSSAQWKSKLALFGSSSLSSEEKERKNPQLTYIYS